MNVAMMEPCGRGFPLLNLCALKVVATCKVGICLLYCTHFLWGRIPTSAMKVRKPLVTTYPLINRHQLNLERNPMNRVCVEKPSEGILTLFCPRGITQE